MAFNYIADLLEQSVEHSSPLRIRGRVIGAVGTVIKATLPQTQIGELCLLRGPQKSFQLRAEVIGFTKEAALLTPLGNMTGICSRTEIQTTGRIHRVAVGRHLLGRVLDGMGNSIDGEDKGPIEAETYYPVDSSPPSALSRQLITAPLALGLKVVDGLLTCGEGQRMGIFGAAGVGKSMLLSILVNIATADVIVVALIGERGREVREFIERQLGPEGMAKAVVVVATSDKPAVERVKAGYVATTIAEYFRDQGKKVLLLMDSVTRFARAQREIGLAAGETPSRRGFPPSVFPALAKLMERAGPSSKGSITAFYAVLVEGNDMDEPIADETRSILDGHIVLSRELAAANHFPAIDVSNSLSRVMNSVVTKEHRKAANRLRNLLAKYEEIELLVKVGEYKKGSDPAADEALSKINAIQEFFRQDFDENVCFDETLAKMLELSGDGWET